MDTVVLLWMGVFGSCSAVGPLCRIKRGHNDKGIVKNPTKATVASYEQRSLPQILACSAKNSIESQNNYPAKNRNDSGQKHLKETLMTNILSTTVSNTTTPSSISTTTDEELANRNIPVIHIRLPKYPDAVATSKPLPSLPLDSPSPAPTRSKLEYHYNINKNNINFTDGSNIGNNNNDVNNSINKNHKMSHDVLYCARSFSSTRPRKKVPPPIIVPPKNGPGIPAYDPNASSCRTSIISRASPAKTMSRSTTLTSQRSGVSSSEKGVIQRANTTTKRKPSLKSFHQVQPGINGSNNTLRPPDPIQGPEKQQQEKQVSHETSLRSYGACALELKLTPNSCSSIYAMKSPRPSSNSIFCSTCEEGSPVSTRRCQSLPDPSYLFIKSPTVTSTTSSVFTSTQHFDNGANNKDHHHHQKRFKTSSSLKRNNTVGHSVSKINNNSNTSNNSNVMACNTCSKFDYDAIIQQLKDNDQQRRLEDKINYLTKDLDDARAQVVELRQCVNAIMTASSRRSHFSTISSPYTSLHSSSVRLSMFPVPPMPTSHKQLPNNKDNRESFNKSVSYSNRHKSGIDFTHSRSSSSSSSSLLDPFAADAVPTSGTTTSEDRHYSSTHPWIMMMYNDSESYVEDEGFADQFDDANGRNDGYLTKSNASQNYNRHNVRYFQQENVDNSFVSQLLTSQR